MTKICAYLLVFLFSVTLAAKLPAGFQICKKGDSALKSCLKQAIQDTLIKLENGIPDLGAPSIEPLVIPSAIIGEGKGAVSVVQKYKDFKLYNLFHSKIENIDAAFTDTDFKIDIDFYSPEYRIVADYDFNGRILLVPIVGTGPCNITFKDIKTHLHLSGEVIEKKGKPYLNIKDCTVSINAGKVTYNFENLFNGDERLGKEMNNLLNENWKDVFEDVRPGYEEVLSNVFRSYINNIFSKVPYDQLLPK